MPKYLLINSESEFPQDWRLADDADIEAVQASLRDCMRSGEVLEITVVIGKEGRVAESTLFVNGSKLTSAAVIEAEQSRTS